MSLWELCLRFLYVGLFTVGGGLATIPLMIQAVVDTGLITEDMFYSMLAVSQSTPGPIGVNLATYIGFENYGVIGGLLVTLSIGLPCFVISSLVSKAYERFSNAKAVRYAFYGIRAAVCGLIASAALGVLKITVFTADAFRASGSVLSLIDWKAALLFAVLYLLVIRFQKHPVLYIALGGLAGFLFIPV